MSNSHWDRLLGRRPVAWAIAILTGLAVGLVRFVPYEYRWANLAPIGALCLFSGARLGGWAGFAWPLVVMLVSDWLMFQLTGWVSFDPYVVSAYAAIVAVGWLARSVRSPFAIGGLALVGSTVFFVVSNFGAWRQLIGNPYSDDLAGLIACYMAGIPFARGTVLGDLMFTAILFSAHYALAKAYSPSEIALSAGEPA